MIQEIGTVSIWVDDFDAALHFYSDVLGLALITRPGEVPHFSVGDSMLVLLKGNYCLPTDAFPSDFPQVTFKVDNLNAAILKLREHGIEIPGTLEERRDSRWIKLKDPAGNLLELVEVK